MARSLSTMSGPYRTTACNPSRAELDTTTAAPHISRATRIMSSVSTWSSTTSTRSPERSTLRQALRRGIDIGGQELRDEIADATAKSGGENFYLYNSQATEPSPA